MSISAPENAADVAVAAAAERQRRTGVLTGMASYALWGLFPLYFHALSPTTPVEILAHRVVWSFLGMMGLLTLRREWGWIAELRRDRARLGRIWLAGVLLAINWLVYVWAVTADRVIDASLGYFVNPLVTVAMGVVLLGEHIRRGQAIALGLGGVAVVVLAVGYGEVPWVALVLALSFGGYGFLKKQVALEPVASLAAETTIVFPAALVWLGWQIGSGHATFGHHGTLLDAKLLALGIVTAVPLLLFGAATRRIPLVLIGLLQYITPWEQFLLGWLHFGEKMPPERFVGFVLIWAALVVLAIDAWRTARA
ncbi:MAG: EamA family transporter RarD [Microthrixaceae bacterium]|jgi:chloramphenicol-sensitive protein RarD|nr:EamA family transporter RarD [Actinomycetota bacterium]HMT23565.1 EamA family transporter RarD [Microthrixaceae bacterium]HMT61202.1 EamA family transporter RarD [Microthrixaceae bacterium]